MKVSNWADFDSSSDSEESNDCLTIGTAGSINENTKMPELIRGTQSLQLPHYQNSTEKNKSAGNHRNFNKMKWSQLQSQNEIEMIKFFDTLPTKQIYYINIFNLRSPLTDNDFRDYFKGVNLTAIVRNKEHPTIVDIGVATKDEAIKIIKQESSNAISNNLFFIRTSNLNSYNTKGARWMKSESQPNEDIIKEIKNIPGRALYFIGLFNLDPSVSDEEIKNFYKGIEIKKLERRKEYPSVVDIGVATQDLAIKIVLKENRTLKSNQPFCIRFSTCNFYSTIHKKNNNIKLQKDPRSSNEYNEYYELSPKKKKS